MPPNPGQLPVIPNLQIQINRKNLPLEYLSSLLSVTLDLDTELPSMFTLELAGTDSQNSSPQGLDDTVFDIGNEIQIDIHYGRQPTLRFSGEITSLEPEFTFDQLPTLVVRGYDRRHRLLRGRYTRTFVQQTDSAIATTIAKEAGLDINATNSSVTHEFVMQANQTNMEFLQERARRIQYEMLIDNKTLIFRPVANASSPNLTLTLTSDLLEFYPRLAATPQVGQVDVCGWDEKNKEAIAGSATKVTASMGSQSGPRVAENGFGSNITKLINRLPQTPAEASQIAIAHLNTSALNFITGEGICWGRTDLLPGKVIQLQGLGKRFSGNYYVTTTQHLVSQNAGYETRFSVRRNAT